ncbi:hypothetical protein HMN09_00326700 [Mycena chlorophos]|uniref:Uncharacterized protein n=1 Tax=Mycena chlorophos TaxID=658473 RepID=A0A8H6TG08_MYCCL|nr:hypothetical protein HMN09_00326700 [Mycena chlorophos]
MGEEWAGKAARGEDFLLLADMFAGQCLSDGPIASFAPDDDAQLRPAPPPACRAAQFPAAAAAIPMSTPARRIPSPVALASLADVKEGLERASGLLDVVEQLESGHVKYVRDTHGPNTKTNRGAADGWDGLRSMVNKRERLGKILNGPKNFAGDEEKFLAYFKMPAPTGKGKRARGPDEEDGGYRAYRRIVEAWVWCKRHVEKERETIEYQGLGRWEVWRALGKETYVKPPRQADDAELDKEKDSDDE